MPGVSSDLSHLRKELWMGIFDKFKSQVKGKKAEEMSDTAERKINEKTGNKYESQVDDAQRRAEGALGMDRDRPEQP
jgi:spore germination cell wall hydrolase CwlJ-like protein